MRSEQLLGRPLNEITGIRADLETVRAEISGLRTEFDSLRAEFGGLRTEQERLWREIARLRIDLTARVERVLNEQAALRDDMAVVMARLDRVDATSHGAVSELRALHWQFTRLAARVTAIEDRGAKERGQDE